MVQALLLAFILTSGAATAAPAGSAATTQPPERVVVSCDTGGTEILDRVCPILIDTLNRSVGGSALFVADDGPAGAASHVRLETTLAGKSMLRGRLYWRRGVSGTATPEPEVTLTVSDGELTEAAIGNFARALVKVSELPLGE